MKSINKQTIDAMAEARKMSGFSELSADAAMRLRLAVEIYQGRERLSLSQQDLARMIKSTQKVISHLENGDINVGLSLLNRISLALNFRADNWAKIFNFNLPGFKLNSSAQVSGRVHVIKESKTSNMNTSFSFSKK